MKSGTRIFEGVAGTSALSQFVREAIREEEEGSGDGKGKGGTHFAVVTDALKQCEKNNLYTVAALREVARLLESKKRRIGKPSSSGDNDDDDGNTLRRLLRGSSGVMFSPHASPRPSAALVARRKYLRLKQEEREYYRMVKGGLGIGKSAGSSTSSSSSSSSSIRQIAVGLNVIILPIAIFIATDVMGRSMGWSPVSRYTLGLFAAVIMLIIETVLFVIRAMRAERMCRKAKTQAPKDVFLASSPSAATAAAMLETTGSAKSSIAKPKID